MDKGTVGIIGAGTMGRGIAQVAASVGYDVILNDTTAKLVDSSTDRLRQDLARLVDKGKLEGAARDAILSHIRGSVDLRDMSAADIVVEAIFEDLDAKKKLFAALDEYCRPDVILGSNSSSLSILDMAMATKRPEKVVGIHFFNPVPLMKGVELVCTITTSFQTLEYARQFSASLGKQTWVAKDAPGFLSTRLLIPYLLDAMRLLESGFATKEDIDACCVLSFNYPMGPLTLSDLIGLDVLLNIANGMYGSFKDPKFAAPILLEKKVKAGQLGRKAGRGFYEYT
ncbi:MAG: 3-hydroxybutyryl-CoA dehydrogenase [Dehalococcoidia bacterium]|jgi:3-hydroxybutyryl-CoA dehydrogenase|nr:3-hydroxybutyryl-CoA dehydrogenase [Dehalococcoidia bacterium]